MAVKKNKIKKSDVEQEPKEKEPERYFYAIGRRKTSVAQARVYVKDNAKEIEYIVNNKKAAEYFPLASLQAKLSNPIRSVGLAGSVSFSILVKGGGFKGQAEASQLAIARALVKYDEGLRKNLKDLGFLTRDARKVERKKPGLKKARRAPQWAKR